MIRSEYPAAEIRCGENLFAIEYFRVYPDYAEAGSPFNSSFCIRVVSGGFCGYAPCEYDVREFKRFVCEMEELYCFRRRQVELCDICYGSKVLFSTDRTGHIEISGEIFGSGALHSLSFTFEADQTCLSEFIKTVKGYISGNET